VVRERGWEEDLCVMGLGDGRPCQWLEIGLRIDQSRDTLVGSKLTIDREAAFYEF